LKERKQTPLSLVVGAGMTGLTAASQLARAGRPCLLVEAAEAVGGLCRTYQIDGIPFDLGPHVFFNDPDSEVGLFTQELLKGEPLLKRPYRFGIQARGRWWSFPLSLPEVAGYPRRYHLEMARALVAQRLKPGPHPESLADFMRAKAGPSIYAEVFADLVYKKTLLSGEDLHCHWWLRVERDAMNRLEPPRRALKAGRLLERLKRKLTPWYLYPKRGYQRIADLLHERYAKAGGRTMVNCGPIALHQGQGRIEAASIQGVTHPVREVVWTGTVKALNAVLGAQAPALPYVDMVIVCLTYDQPRPLRRPFIYTYHPQPELIFNRVYYPANIYETGLPAGREGLCLELNLGPEIAGLTDDELLARALEGVERLGLAPAKALRQSRLFRLQDALPVYGLDYQARLAEALAPAHQYDNLIAVGRQGGHFFCLSPAAIGQGLKAAARALAQT
jgi:protoporphyrinogen oxidase